jgi:VWFA-related protein
MRSRPWPIARNLVFLSLALSVLRMGRAFAEASAPQASSSQDPGAGAKTKAQPDPDITKQTPGIHVRSNLVTMPVTVLDRSGQFVYDLSPSDFQIYDNGVPQQMSDFETELNALNVVVVVETNNTTGPLLDQVQPLASVFSSLLIGAEGQAAVITYDDRVRVNQDFSSNADLLDKALKHLSVSGSGARLNDALWRALAMLETRPKSDRRVIVAFSDGFDSGSETHSDAVIRRATTDGIGIYGLGFSPGHELLSNPANVHHVSPEDQNVAQPTPSGMPPTPSAADEIHGMPVEGIPILTDTGHIIRSKLAKNLLQVYAGYTGGVFYSHWKDRALQNQLQQVASEIHSQYELSYVPNNLGQTGFHRLTVKVERRGVKVRTRAGYFYGGTTR